MKKLLSHYAFFFFISMLSDVHGTLDVETLPTLRTQRYSMGPYGKIMIFSAPRTGSSLLYNVFSFLFENEEHLLHPHNKFQDGYSVLKTHQPDQAERFPEENVLFIVPVRHPLHAAISTYRIRTAPIRTLKMFCKQIINKQVNHLVLTEEMKANGRNVLFLKYEDFEKNIDYIFDFIENNLSISISDQDKSIIKNGYSKENISACVDALPDFREYLPISGFHGKHITLQKYNPPEEVVYWLNYYLLQSNPIFRKYGY